MARCVPRRCPNSQTGRRVFRAERRTRHAGINSVLPSLSTNIYPGYIRLARFPAPFASEDPSSVPETR